MDSSTPLTDDLFGAFLKCPYKAYLKLRGETGERSDYERTQCRRSAEYRVAATSYLLAKLTGAAVIQSPPSLPDAIQSGVSLITDTVASDGGETCRLDALENLGDKAVPMYRPILFVRREKVTVEDRFLLGFGASILGRLQGTTPEVGKIVHGSEFKQSRVELVTLAGSVGETVRQLRDLTGAKEPPPLTLNKHCGECEFRRRCRAAAVEKDDLSLLGGLSSKSIASLHQRGIFTVTQYSHTFRPRRIKRAASRKHDQSLQALAIREHTIYVAQRPEFPRDKTALYLDVEGLPDEGWDYLIGLTISGGQNHHLSFWADNQAEEAAIRASFLAAVEQINDFVLFHYGSYEARFVDRMETRYGGNPDLIARLRASMINVLSLIYSRVYFPVHSNDLKSVAGCLGFRWTDPESSGLQSIAWRLEWEVRREESFKRSLLTYNQEDCAALERVVGMLASLGSECSAVEGGPRVSGMEDVGSPYRHRFGATRFALPEFARITKCAYFDYQRDKVLCRTSPGVKKIRRRKRRPKERKWKVNCEIECGIPTACQHCGSQGFDQHSRHRKLVVDLRPFRGGLKRWVTAYKVKRYRCRKCLNTQLPEDYLTAAKDKLGDRLCGWVAYAWISLRQSDDSIVQALKDLFDIPICEASVVRLRRRAAERYRRSHDSLMASLRSSPVAHADETKVETKGPPGNGYVWVFANPTTALYVYSPTRDGAIVEQTLAGFRGVLVSDFYAVYDSLDCPQQKCLIHLIRDFNDDLLSHPFDEELKQQAARFTVLLQSVVATIDRYGLRQYHLNKHRRDVERFFEAESRAAYESEIARHYQLRLLKYRGKLFTFLDYDGIPWNNNNAENAIKQFASRRQTFRTPFTEAGIRDYLLMLSIYQTLRYRNANFWRFLLSGETDIEAFAGPRR
jgi:predicted RecB family nuclease